MSEEKLLKLQESLIIAYGGFKIKFGICFFKIFIIFHLLIFKLVFRSFKLLIESDI